MAIKSNDIYRLHDSFDCWTEAIVGAVEHTIDTYLATNEAGGSSHQNAYVIYLPFTPSVNFKERLIAKYKSGWRKVTFEDFQDRLDLKGGTVMKLYSL